jgi:hypothetical protein
MVTCRAPLRLEQSHNDPILSYQAMGEIFDDPQKGPRRYWHLILALLLTLELSYVICSEYLARANRMMNG